jgi:hypothetical protein
MILTRSFIGFLKFTRKSLGKIFKETLERKISTIQEELQQFFDPKKSFWTNAMNIDDYIGSTCKFAAP